MRKPLGVASKRPEDLVPQLMDEAISNLVDSPGRSVAVSWTPETSSKNHTVIEYLYDILKVRDEKFGIPMPSDSKRREMCVAMNRLQEGHWFQLSMLPEAEDARLSGGKASVWRGSEGAGQDWHYPRFAGP